MKKVLGIIALVGIVAIVAASALGIFLWRRALPTLDGSQRVPTLSRPVEVLRDPWGIPHIFASSDEDAYFALGWAMAQDRLFQVDLIRHVATGRVAEWFGEDALGVDKLFRTVGIPGAARRMMAAASPEATDAFVAFSEGLNAYGRHLGSALPPEYLLIGASWEPFRPEELAAVVGYMTWGLNPSWRMDVLHEKIRARLGPRRTALLFPYTQGAGPSAYPKGGQATVIPKGGRVAESLKVDRLPARLPRLSESQQDFLAAMPGLSGSNSWVVGPRKSASGMPILANDPHLELRHPSIWYQAHLKSPTQEVSGVYAPGVPFAVVGRNRNIAWGLTNLMADQGDFYIEKIRPGDPGEVLVKGRWQPLRKRQEVMRVKDAAPVELDVTLTPHGPIVTELLPGQTKALSYRWIYTDQELNAASGAEENAPNEIDGFHQLNRAHDWRSFRAAVSRFGAVAQNITYADREGHIGMQSTGRLPLLRPGDTGTRFREGWSGRDEWNGTVPFEEMPMVFDPPEGFVAGANNPTLPRPMPRYVSAYWEPLDRIRRIRELLQGRERFSIDDLARMQGDTMWWTARETAPLIVAAFSKTPPDDPSVRAAVRWLQGWKGEMGSDSQAAAVFALFYKHLFHRIFADELSPELAASLREKGNFTAIMIRAALFGEAGEFLDRTDTPAVETRQAILRSALRAGVKELTARLGDDPSQWQWGRLHTFTLKHPLGRVKWLAPFFNDGPHPKGGHALTVAKAQFKDDDFLVFHGASTRQLTDMAHPEWSLAVIPGGQSGIPASSHYTDLLNLWLTGAHHPLLMERGDIEKVALHRLTLRPN